MSDIKKYFSRRDFLGNMCSLTALGLIYATGGCEKLPDEIKNRPVRRDLAGLSAGDPVVQAYKDAVAAMKALPLADPRNWVRQAQIYLNHSPRGNWYFLPWHRAYLAYFEKICRQLSGYSRFALPYWNWTANPRIPSVFQGDGSNALFNTTRIATPSEFADPAFTSPASINNVLSQTSFQVFGGGAVNEQRAPDTVGLLESTAQNGIQSFAGGDMATLMAPLDPLFWPHQAMIDRCWTEWNLNRRRDNPSDSKWVNFTFSDFADEHGNAAGITVQETVLLPILAYTWDDFQPGQSGPGLSSAERRALETFVRKGAPAQWNFSRRFELQKQVVMEIGGSPNRDIRIDPAPIKMAIESGRNRLLLKVDEVELSHPADFFLRVFVNEPAASTFTPIEDPHYAGSFAMFFDEREGFIRRENPSFLVDITDTLRHLNQSGVLADSRAGIQLVAAPFPHRALRPQKLTIGRLELGVLPAEP